MTGGDLRQRIDARLAEAVRRRIITEYELGPSCAIQARFPDGGTFATRGSVTTIEFVNRILAEGSGTGRPPNGQTGAVPLASRQKAPTPG